MDVSPNSTKTDRRRQRIASARRPSLELEEPERDAKGNRLQAIDDEFELSIFIKYVWHYYHDNHVERDSKSKAIALS